jgi:hypothetical protein
MWFWKAFAFTVILVCFGACSVHRMDMNKLTVLGITSSSMRSDQRLQVKYKGRNTVNSLWVRDIGNDRVLVDSICLARERIQFDFRKLEAGTYEVAYSGCWTDHAVILTVQDTGR